MESQSSEDVTAKDIRQLSKLNLTTKTERTLH